MSEQTNRNPRRLDFVAIAREQLLLERERARLRAYVESWSLWEERRCVCALQGENRRP